MARAHRLSQHLFISYHTPSPDCFFWAAFHSLRSESKRYLIGNTAISGIYSIPVYKLADGLWQKKHLIEWSKDAVKGAVYEHCPHTCYIAEFVQTEQWQELSPVLIKAVWGKPKEVWLHFVVVKYWWPL